MIGFLVRLAGTAVLAAGAVILLKKLGAKPIPQDPPQDAT